MTTLDEVLVSLVSLETGVVTAVVGWAARRSIRQVERTAERVERLSDVVERHLAWHEGAGHGASGQLGPRSAG